MNKRQVGGAFVVACGVALLLWPSQAQEAGSCTTLIDCAQKAMEAAFQAKTAIRVAVPKGAVMAFNLPQCPDGWANFQPLVGRVAIGAGVDPAGTLTARALGETGGEEMHTLSVAEMPAHAHNYTFSSGVNSPRSTDTTPSEFGSKDQNPETSTTGGNAPHNNMQPFTVLTYCVRT